MLRDGGNDYSRAKPYRSAKSNSTGEGAKRTNSPMSERSSRRSHTRHQHRHGSPKNSRHHPRPASHKHYDMGESGRAHGKSPPPNKALKLSRGKSSHGSSSDVRNERRRMDQMNDSGCSTSPESIKSPESAEDSSDQHRPGMTCNTDSNKDSGISSMSSSNCSDYSPNPISFSDKERESSLSGNDTTDTGSDGFSPQSVNICHTSNFKSNLSTVLEVDTNLSQTPLLQPISSSASDQENSSSYVSTGEKFCLVCNDKATGYHFNALTCEGCKGFFRRNSQKADELKCSFNGCCNITKVTRRHCQACRLNKCFKVGMLTECIMTEEQKVVRKMKNSDKHGSNMQQDRSSNFGVSPPFTPNGAPNHGPPGMPHHLTGDYSQIGGGRPHSICSCTPSGGRCNACLNSEFYQNDLTVPGTRLASSGSGKAGQVLGSGGFVPPNQEQLALMEELSIEYHNLYSKRATVEDVISNVPMRPKTMDLPVGGFRDDAGQTSPQIPSNIYPDKLNISAPAQVSLTPLSSLPSMGVGMNVTEPATGSLNNPQTDRLLVPVEPFQQNFKMQQQQQSKNVPFSNFQTIQTSSDISNSTSFEANNGIGLNQPKCDQQQIVSYNNSINSPFATTNSSTLDNTMQVAPYDPLKSSGQSTIPCTNNQFSGYVESEQQNDDGQQQSLPPQPADSNEMHLSAMCKYLAAITSNRLERCVAFCQRMPGFQLLSLQDKMSLLKSGAFEILLLRSSIFMDTSLGKIRAGSFSLTPEMLMRIPYLRPFVVPFFVFISKFKSLNCDLTELLLLIGIVIFSPDRPGIHNRDAISNIQQVYADTLQAYLSTKFCQAAFDQKELPSGMYNQILPNPPQQQQHMHVKTEHGANATCAAVASQQRNMNMQQTSDDGYNSCSNQLGGPGQPRTTMGYSTPVDNSPHSFVGMTNPMIHPISHKLSSASSTSSSSPNSNSCPITPTGPFSNQQSITSFNANQKSLSSRVMKSRIRFGNLMMQICMLRSVNFEHSQSVLKIDVRRKEDLGPFLREMCSIGIEDAPKM